MPVLALVYFLAADWEPCYRGRQALLLVMLFNLWVILPLAPAGAEEARRGNVSAAATPVPLTQTPPWLRLAGTAARALVGATCYSLPRAWLKADLLPEGIRECAPLPLRLILALILLVLKVVVLFAFMLPLALLAALAATIGLVLAHSGLLCARLSAWMSALVTLAAANMLVASLGGMRRAILGLHSQLCIAKQSRARLAARLPPPPVPSFGLHELKALRAFVLNNRQDRAAVRGDTSALVWFSTASDLVACSASLLVQSLNEVAIYQRNTNGGGRRGVSSHFDAFAVASGGAQGGSSSGGSSSGSSYEYGLSQSPWNVSSVRSGVRYLAMIGLACHCAVCAWSLLCLLLPPSYFTGSSSSNSSSSSSSESAGSSSIGLVNDSAASELPKKGKKERRRLILVESDEDSYQDDE